MAKELIYSVTSVDLSLNRKLPPDLVIDAHGETRSNHWTDPELQPWIYIEPPLDGVYDFDFVAQPPSGPSNPVITPIQAQHVWKDLPDHVRGIRVHSETNSVTEWLRPCQSCRLRMRRPTAPPWPRPPAAPSGRERASRPERTARSPSPSTPPSSRRVRTSCGWRPWMRRGTARRRERFRFR